MKRWLLATAIAFMTAGGGADAHRLDEYLQATLFSIDHDHVQASLRMVPGIAVSSAIIAAIDSNGDGVLSPTEQWTYAQRVLGGLSLSIDGARLQPKLVSVNFPPLEQMRGGLGEIQIEYGAALPPGGPNRRLVLESPHQEPHAAYLVNVLVPSDHHIHVVSQNRNERQSVYELDYVQTADEVAAVPVHGSGIDDWAGSSGFASLFRLGLRHIAEGTDHLLFLLALLLPAPLLARGPRWADPASIRKSLTRILTVVSAFTLGHSLTLALAALGFVSVPSRPIEVLIAVSILVSALHALRPLFPSREGIIAAFFGLIHGLAFATTLGQLGLGRWERVGGILAFNLGIEAMQLVVVAAVLPSLILMSRTGAYACLRIGGALFAGLAAGGWIAERLFGLPDPLDPMVQAVAHQAPWIALVLFLVSLGTWLHQASNQAAPRIATSSNSLIASSGN
jgi:hypothetical protein